MKISMKKASVTILLMILLLTTISAVSASMSIEGGSFSTDGGLEDKTYASINVGAENAGKDVIIQIFYSRDGSALNNGNMVPVTVNSNGYVEVSSADAYKYFPDHAKIKLYDKNEHLLDSQDVDLSPTSGLQTFGSYTDYSSSSSSGTGGSSGGGSTNSYHSGTSDTYVGNSNTGKFHAPGCGSVDKMKPSNKVYFSSRDEAISSGYTPCKRCNP
ncbi:hypothetical protein TL18_04495 [Methanobrevibacter sp. YE315]|uniref:Ada metal-binding domain-containing protein n=1 Tax=Methanobrevibacter sp. YE315 TaxID=1609968 RepID=UPI000764D9CF|nr:Ada metal-binding domain-containing protein [Methanobrevibacter sp. YE315]AMD17346.1 hypothetical protein TL18_04495 [Methanobrevibacter sp. YE315]